MTSPVISISHISSLLLPSCMATSKSLTSNPKTPAAAGATGHKSSLVAGGKTAIFLRLNQSPSGYVKIAIENGYRNSGFTH